MTAGEVGRRQDRVRAFVPTLIPEPADLDRTGPLDAREQRDLDRIHGARDNHQNARWMRGKALEAAFRRRLFRGEDGRRTRQEYLNDEWDGISESAAYLEIKEWRLAAQIAETCDHPAPDSHVRALVEVAAHQGPEIVAVRYSQLRRYGAEQRLKVTAPVVKNLAVYLATGETPAVSATDTGELQSLFVRRQLPVAKKPRVPAQTEGSSPETRQTSGDGSDDEFQNFGKPENQSTLDERADSTGGQDQDVFNPLVAKAARASSTLDGMRHGFVEGGLLPHAPVDILKAIASSAQAIAAAAEAELNRR
ncbi:hypothetical protein ACFQ7N_38735 [Streptomyces niveus]|uniref:hypothetical protein n=1 Tax=Streptomyces niveus TaxID=193462 RepID=UPI0036968B6F